PLPRTGRGRPRRRVARRTGRGRTPPPGPLPEAGRGRSSCSPPRFGEGLGEGFWASTPMMTPCWPSRMNEQPPAENLPRTNWRRNDGAPPRGAPMTVQDLQRLFDYGYWANAKLFPVISRLTPAQVTQFVDGS